MMEHGIARATEILRGGGRNKHLLPRAVLSSPGHLLGTARMGTDPERSVVNEWGRCHDVKNLFIVDGSIWVTSGGVNPTSTIQALALYIADSIKQRLDDPVRLTANKLDLDAPVTDALHAYEQATYRRALASVPR